MKLNLKKPVVFFDIESTGLSVSKDRIVELGLIKVNPDQSEETLTLRINPEMPISKESEEIHGISLEDLKDAPTFKDVAERIVKFIDDADLAGYNSNKFDVPMLLEEFSRVGVDFKMSNRKAIDVQNIFHKKEQRTLAAAYQFYCDKEIENAHSAEADIRATYEVLKAQLDRYPDLENDMDYLAEFSQNSKHKLLDFAGRLAINKNGEPIYNFGKHKDKTIQDVFNQEPGYHAWMLNNDFPFYTKKVLKEITDKLKEKKQAQKAKKKVDEAKKMESKLDQLKHKFGN
ncbi:MAG: exonuclease domain-containing protein [Putridiphycobacter sp.]